MASVFDFNQDIVNGELKNFYILTGPEIGLMNIYIDHLQGEIKRETSVKNVWRSLTQKGIIPNNSIYVIRDDEEFVKNERLANNLNSIKYGKLILLVTDEKRYKKVIEKYPENTVVFDKMTTEQLEAHFSNKYSDIDFEAVKEVIDLCENDFSRVDNELDKINRLSSTVDNFEAIDNLIHTDINFEVFEAIDSVIQCFEQDSFLYIDDMFANKVSALGFLTMLYNQFISAIKVMGNKNNSAQDLGISQFIINKIKYNFKFSYDSAVEGSMIIADTIEGIKQGKYSEKFGTYLCLCRILNLY